MTKKFALAVSLTLLGFSLIALVIPSFYARFMADDYCMNAGAQNASLPIFLETVYNGWSGRFAYIISTFFLSKIPAQAFGFLVAASVFIWVLVLAQVLKKGSGLVKINLDMIESHVLASFLLIALFKTAPNLYQNLYWRDGLVNYIFPLIFTSLSLLLMTEILETRLNVFYALALFITAFLSTGFSESASIANLTFWAALCIFTLFLKQPHKKATLILLGIPAIGTLLGFLFEFLAPGNLVRSAILPDKPGVLELAGLTLRNVAHLYGRLLIYGFPWVLISLLLGLFLGYSARLSSKITFSQKDTPYMGKWLIGAVLVNLLLGSGVCAAVAYLLKAYPDDRIILIPYFFALLTIATTGLIVGNWLVLRSSAYSSQINQKTIRFGSYTLVALGIVLAFYLIINLINTLPAITDYAQRWDMRDALIRAELAAGKQDLIIPGLESQYGLPDLQLEKEDWVNNCTAGYYGAKSITGK